MSTEDEAIARLRDADPARGLETETTSLRAAVDARTQRSEHEQPNAPVDELERRRAQRSRRHAWVAGVAASVLVGVAGYTAGMTMASGGAGGGDSAADSAAGGAAEPSVADDDGEAAGGGPMEPGSLNGGGAAEESDAAADSTDLMWGSTRAVFIASGLPGEAGDAEAFGYDPTGVASADTAADVASALGVEGDVVEEVGYWMVGQPDGRNVIVYDDGTASLSYSDPSLDPWACAVQGGEVDPDSGVSEGDEGGGADGFGGCATDGAGPADPIATATDFLTTIGVDVSGLDLVVEYSEAGSAAVSGYLPEVDHSMGGLWSLTVTDAGVYSAWGWLAPQTSLGDYDVISATDAVERLMDPRFGASNGVMPLATAEAGADTAVSSEPQQPPSAVQPVEPGAPIAWPVTTYTITDAELTRSTYTLPDGAVVLLPTWSLTAADDGGTWTVVALTEAGLDFEG